MRCASLLILSCTIILHQALGSSFQDALEKKKQARAAASQAASNPPPAPKPFTIPAWASSVSYLPSSRDGYTSVRRSSPNYKVYHNLWWAAHRWYAFLRPEDMNRVDAVEDGVSVNNGLQRTPVADMEGFKDNLRVAYVPGNSLLVDFPFQQYPDHFGHWAEMMVPTYSMLKNRTWRNDVQHAGTPAASMHIDRVVTPNMNRGMNPWFQAVFQAAMTPGVKPGLHQPQIVDYADLEAYDKLGWIVFENLIVVQDRYTHPQNKKGFAGSDYGDLWRYDNCERYVSQNVSVGFLKPDHGADLRSAIYARENQPPPQPWVQGTPPQLPTTITLMMHSGDDFPMIANHMELMDMLHDVAAAHGLKARAMTLTSDASFGSHLTAAARSAVLIGRHSALMAASMLLKPGSMVLELLPFKWEWAKLTMLYHNITQSMGDIHHFAWRANHWQFAEFRNTSHRKYHTWKTEECHARECLSTMGKLPMKVDVAAVKQILLEKLPRVLRGEAVAALREPWPGDTWHLDGDYGERHRY